MPRYAGIGSRQTPPAVLADMTRIARHLYARGYTLCSGGAIGADKAFEIGADDRYIVYLAEMAKKEWLWHASLFHPAWDQCSYRAKMLHARNSAIVLGNDLNSPVEFVACWTPGGTANGCTGQAIRVAEAYGIPVYNLFNVRMF